jgi:hypothetical protein
MLLAIYFGPSLLDMASELPLSAKTLERPNAAEPFSLPLGLSEQR